jgi:hypothetical protein
MGNPTCIPLRCSSSNARAVNDGHLVPFVHKLMGRSDTYYSAADDCYAHGFLSL